MRLDLAAAGALPARLSASVWRLGAYHLAAFLVRGRGQAALFEVGVSGTAPVILEQLAGLGVAPEEVRWVVLSHAHADHAAGQAGLLAGLPRAELVLSQGSRRHLAKPGVAGEFAAEDAYTTGEILAREGLGGPAAAGELLPSPARVMAPGQALELGGVSLELAGAEGHVPAGLTGWVPQEGVLLASDSAGYASRGEPGFPMYFVSLGAYRDNLARLTALGPEVVGLGHQDSFSGREAGAWLEAVARQLDREHRAVLAGLARGRGEEELAGEMFARWYCDELTVFPAETIRLCCGLLVRRSREFAEG
jgi:glyoxylase-like metal-dependent hydrolase (beta-lactamase superfamily II)